MGASTALNQAIRDRFAAQWAIVGAGVPVEMPNSPTEVNKSGPVWARFSVLSDMTPEHEAAGPGSSERYYDRLLFEIFARLGTGNLAALQVADAFASIWRHDPTDGTPPIASCTFRPTQVIEIGREADGQFYKVDCMTPFERSHQP